MNPARRDELFPSSKVFCNPQVLNAFQNSPLRRFTDSKTFVDLELKKEPEEVLKLFSSFPVAPSREEFDSFVDQVFKDINDEEGSLIRPTLPIDYTAELPLFLKRLQQPNDLLIDFVLDLKGRWRELCREFVNSDAVKIAGTRSSLIALPFPFFIPGGRFRECYYWDTLWIVKGLVACQMLESAKGAVRNLFHMVDRIGFVPNGNRVYYVNRSQPPTLTEAVRVIYDAMSDHSKQEMWLEEAVPYLDKEYCCFSELHSVSSLYPDEPFSHFSLSLYNADTIHPRPESFREDTASLNRRLKSLPPAIDEKREARLLYKNLASAAESGWDFSSRWLPESAGCTLEDTEICNIVPCCLNSILLKAEHDLAFFHRVLAGQGQQSQSIQTTVDSNDASQNTQGHLEMSQRYGQLAEKRKISMNELLWNEDVGFWFDYNLMNGKRSEVVSCAGLMPVWAGCWEEKWNLSDAKCFVNFVLSSSGLLHPGGLSCTTQASAEQWDFPNCWPPLVDFAVESLRRLEKKFPECGAEAAAETIANRFLETAYRGWLYGGVMHEKYDSRVNTGERGMGGEYKPQTGFGWTNGTVLWLLQDFAESLNTIAVKSFQD